MNSIELKTHPRILAPRAGLVPFAKSIQAASQGRIAFTANGVRLADQDESRLDGIDLKRAGKLLGEAIEHPLRPGIYPLEMLLALCGEDRPVERVLEEFYRKHLPFVADDAVAAIESRLLKVFLLGSAGTGVVSAVQDMAGAFAAAGYFGRAFPLFDPSKKGAPVRGFGVIGREPILAHTAFKVPDIILLFDHKMFPLLRETLADYRDADPQKIAILVNTALTPGDFRSAADFQEPYLLHTLDADALLRGRRIPPNYAMIGGLLGMLYERSIDKKAFSAVVKRSLEDKFGAGDKLDANMDVFLQAQKKVRREAGEALRYDSLGPVTVQAPPAGQAVMFEDGNQAIARAVALVLNQFPSVVAAYPITPQTPIVETLARMVVDGELCAESVTPESEHGAGGALLGAARDRVMTFTATSSQGFALMSEVVHSMSGLRMGNVLISDVLRSLNSPLDVENDHSDLYKVGLDAGYLVFMTRDVQQAFDFHLMAYLVSMYAEYRETKTGPADGDTALEMIPDRSVMLPAIVASEGFEVSHAPERYLALDQPLAQRLYDDPRFEYLRTYVNTPNRSIMGTLQLSDSRHDTDYQRHLAMDLAMKVLVGVFERFEHYTGRRYGMLHSFNVDASGVVFVVAGAANGTFEQVAREFQRNGVDVGVVHPNVLRPFPKQSWLSVLQGRQVFVYDRDDPFGAVGGRLYTELAGVVNEFALAETGTRLFSRVYGLGGRTPTLSLVRDELVKALRCQAGELVLQPEKQYVGVSL